MSAPKFTPGPWTVVERGDYAIVESRFITIANEIPIKNARLIAAAPDLYTALRHLVEACEMLEVPGISTSESRAALVKAVAP